MRLKTERLHIQTTTTCHRDATVEDLAAALQEAIAEGRAAADRGELGQEWQAILRRAKLPPNDGPLDHDRRKRRNAICCGLVPSLLASSTGSPGTSRPTSKSRPPPRSRGESRTSPRVGAESVASQVDARKALEAAEIERKAAAERKAAEAAAEKAAEKAARRAARKAAREAEAGAEDVEGGSSSATDDDGSGTARGSRAKPRSANDSSANDSSADDGGAFSGDAGGSASSSPSSSEEEEEEEPQLWQVIDKMVLQQAKEEMKNQGGGTAANPLGRRGSHMGPFDPTLSMKEQSSISEGWHEFWSHYRQKVTEGRPSGVDAEFHPGGTTGGIGSSASSHPASPRAGGLLPPLSPPTPRSHRVEIQETAPLAVGRTQTQRSSVVEEEELLTRGFAVKWGETAGGEPEGRGTRSSRRPTLRMMQTLSNGAEGNLAEHHGEVVQQLPPHAVKPLTPRALKGDLQRLPVLTFEKPPAGNQVKSLKSREELRQRNQILKSAPRATVPACKRHKPGLALNRMPDPESQRTPTAKAAARAAELDSATRELLAKAMCEPQRSWGSSVHEYLAVREWRETDRRGSSDLGSAYPDTVRPPGKPLAVVPAFRRPWERERVAERRGHHHKQELSPLQRFAEVCRSSDVHPHPASVKFLALQSERLDIRSSGVSDEDVHALAASLPRLARICTVDMGENERLGDASVCAILRSVSLLYNSSLRSLCFDRCVHLTEETITLCTTLLQDSLRQLSVLDLSGIRIAKHEYSDLATAIEEHPCLKDVRLAETGLGAFDAADMIQSLISNPNLEALEIGWNSLGEAAFQALGRGVGEHMKINTLGLANTGATSLGEVSPLLAFLEHLAGDVTLTAMDISTNSLNGSALYLLEYAFCSHPRMRMLDVSNNPLGLDGMRSLLRMLGHAGCPELCTIRAESCGNGVSSNEFPGLFAEDPSGRYTMNMADPVHRAMLRLLLTRLTQRSMGVGLGNYVRNPTLYSGASGREEKLSIEGCKRPKGLWQVPMQGELKFDLALGDLLVDDVDVQTRPTDVVEGIIRRNKMVLPSERKIHALLSHVKSVTDDNTRSHLLEALSCDFLLTQEQAQALCRSDLKRPNTGEDPCSTCIRLLPCLLSAIHCRTYVLGYPHVQHNMMVEKKGRNLLSLNLDNPTGHYDLDLNWPPDRAAAERLLLLNRWQAKIWKAAGLIDISQWGNGKALRNEVYGGRAISFTAEEWRLPGVEGFQFDYVSLTRPSATARVVSDEAWQQLVNVIRSFIFRNGNPFEQEPPSPTSGAPIVKDDADSRTAAIDVHWVLRSISGAIWIRCRELRELMSVFHDPLLRLDALVTMSLRCVDWAVNGKMVRPKIGQEHWDQFRSRMGYLAVFPYCQPEGSFFKLDLTIPEQKRVLHQLIRLGVNEAPNNLKGPRIDGEPFTAGIPMSWDNYDSIPRAGIVEVTYRCSMDDVKMRIRRKSASTIGGWQALPDETSELQSLVEWWYVLDDVPPEVVRCIVCIILAFGTIGDAFVFCDKNGRKKGILNLKEFTEREFRRRLRSAGCMYGPVPKLLNRLEEPPPMTAQLSSNPARKAVSPKKQLIDSPSAAVGGDDAGEATLIEELTKVYRFLDTSNNGEISRKEFEVLGAIWAELFQSMNEFRDHVIDCFGSLDNGWHFADLNKDGVLEFHEFKALARAYAFDGPIRQIFMYLDKDQDEIIRYDEWIVIDDVSKDPARKSSTSSSLVSSSAVGPKRSLQRSSRIDL